MNAAHADLPPGPDLPETPEARLAAGLAAHVERWALALGSPAPAALAAREAARQLSLAHSAGHVCLGLGELAASVGSIEAADVAPSDTALPATPAAWRRALLASGVTQAIETAGAAAPAARLPLVLDAEDRLYLHRHFDHEQRLARRLAEAARAPDAPSQPATQALLEALFADNAARLQGRPDQQREAAALALRRRLAVISGGPGTGKTTTVVNLLACLLAEQPAARIALAAPTGKAAARMTEAIRARAAHLPEALRARLPGESFTIHRLLGVTPAEGGFVHHAGHRLPIDALVLDEASMLDLALATRLLEAVPDDARIILLGDKDQLAAVEAGAVFAELSAMPGHALAFRENFRFAADSGIGRLAADINAGRTEPALGWLQAGAEPAAQWIDDDGALPAPATLQRLAEGFAPYLQAVQRDPADPAAMAASFGRYRVLCAVREGPRGSLAVNDFMTRHARATLAALHEAAGIDPRSPWYTGRPVMVLRNDPALRLFNGDIGIALPDAQGVLMVWFPEEAGQGWRPIAPARLGAHQTAFAMTVHKSQGSEFDEVLVLLPGARSRVLTRELLYTAVTRARERVTLAGSAAAIAAAIATPTLRHSGLRAALAAWLGA